MCSSSGVFRYTHSNGIYHTACEQDQDRNAQAVSKPVWHIPLLCVPWKTPDDGQRSCPKRVEFNSKNKLEKLVHLVGFIIRRKNPIIRIFCISGWLAVTINPDRRSSIAVWHKVDIMSVTELNWTCWHISSQECQIQKQRQQFESQVLRSAASSSGNPLRSCLIWWIEDDKI